MAAPGGDGLLWSALQVGLAAAALVAAAAVILVVTACLESKRELQVLAARGRELQSRMPGGSRKPRRRLLVLAWDLEPERGKGSRVRRLLGVGKALLHRHDGRVAHTWYIDDPEVDVPSWTLTSTPMCAPIDSVLIVDDEFEDPRVLQRALEDVAFRAAIYRVEYSVYTNYGEYGGPATRGWDPASSCQRWKDGTRTPLKVNLTGFPRRADLSQADFLRNWHHVQSPMSEVIQPRAKYTRSVVLEALTEDAPSFAGFAMEAWPTALHVRDPFLFFDARSPWRLALNICVMVRSVVGFTALLRAQGATYGEYIFESS